MKGRHRIFILVILVFLTTISRADDQYNNLVLKMPRCKGRVYELLDMVSRKIDKTFIYDSDIIDNNKKGKIENGSFTLQQLVRKITGDNNLELKDFGSHLLIVRQTSHPIKPKQGITASRSTSRIYTTSSYQAPSSHRRSSTTHQAEAIRSSGQHGRKPS